MTNVTSQKKEPSLTQQASKGAFWGLSSNLMVSAISFVGTAILARILSPRDFGLLGMATLVTGVVRLFSDLGLGAALIHKKQVDDEYLSTAFWSSLLVSVGLVFISVITAPLAAFFFNEPAVKWIIIVLSTGFVISSISSVHRTLLYKDIRLKKIAVVEVFARFIRVMIILICALMGLGVWSIVVGMVIEGVIKTILFVVVAHWKPSIKLHKEKFKELFRFGRNIYGQGFLNYFNQNMDFIVTGRVLGANLLGFYQFAYNVPYLVKSYVQDGIAPVAFPVFSKVQDDHERLARGFLDAVKYISMITFPAMFCLAFCANDFISVVYGIRWIPAAAPLRFLCFGAALASVHCVLLSFFNAKGVPEIGLKWNILRLPVTVVLILVLSSKGILGVAIAMLTVEVLSIPVAGIATRMINLTFSDYFKALIPAMTSSIFLIITVYVSTLLCPARYNVYLRLLLQVAIGGGSYLFFLNWIYKADLIALCNFALLNRKKVSNERSRQLYGKNYETSIVQVNNQPYYTIFKNILSPLYDCGFKKRKILSYRLSVEKSQWWTREKLRAYQWEELSKLLRHVYAQVPYWREQFDARGLKPADIRTCEDLRKLPVIDKDTIRANYDLMRAANYQGKTWKKSTGGSTGQPLHFEYTPDSYDWRVACSKRGYGWAGCEDGMQQAYIWGVAIGAVPFLRKLKENMHHAFLRQRYYNCFGFTERKMAETLRDMNRTKPEHIIGYTNPLYEFARYIGAPGRLTFKPCSVISAAEKLHEFQREKIQEVFGCPVFNTYGSREFMLIASECAEHKGLHVNVENIYVEILRENGEPANPGEMGDIVITDLHNYGMPFIRYRIGDMGVVSDRVCSCGRGLPLIEDVVGRSLDMIKTPDGRCIPGEFFPHLMKEFVGVQKFQIKQATRDKLTIFIVKNNNWNYKTLDKIRHSVLHQMGAKVSITYKFVDEISLTKTGKHRVVISNILK